MSDERYQKEKYERREHSCGDMAEYSTCLVLVQLCALVETTYTNITAIFKPTGAQRYKKRFFRLVYVQWLK